MKKYKCLHCGEVIENDGTTTGKRYYCNTLCRTLRRAEVNKKNAYVRFQINNRDHFACAFCGKTSYKDGAKLTWMNVSAVANASVDNMITCCLSCSMSMMFTDIKGDVITVIREIIKKRNADFPNIQRVKEALSYIRNDEKMRKKEDE